ncbi:hypothetical protein [Streptomyces sp. NBC_00316]|uniref:hypothetical protein n=1 Tax=Streptomyces sp. NBC_00316 TaxID=2975710 RepID=UPI003FA6ADFD
MSRVRRPLAGVLAAVALLTAATGCAQSVDPIERLGRKAAQKVNHPHPAPSPTAGAQGDHGELGPMVVVACDRWGGPQDSGHLRPSPPLRKRHWWRAGPGPHDAVDAAAGCDRR